MADLIVENFALFYLIQPNIGESNIEIFHTDWLTPTCMKNSMLLCKHHEQQQSLIVGMARIAHTN